MKIESGKIIIDLRCEDSKKTINEIKELEKAYAARGYIKKFRWIADESRKITSGYAMYILKFLPAMILLLAAALDLAFNVLPGTNLTYTILALVYFAYFIVKGDKDRRRKQYKELCEDNFLIEESNELERSKVKNMDKYLLERDKSLANMFSELKSGEFFMQEPFNRLVAVDDSDRIVVANPVSYDTETHVLEYDLHNEIENCTFSENDIIVSELEERKGYVYIDVLSGKIALFV